MGMAQTDERELRYENRAGRVATTGGIGLIAAIVAGQVVSAETSGSAVLWLTLLAPSLVFAWRAWRSNRLVAGGGGVVVHTLLRRYQIPWNEVVRFRAEIGTAGTWTRAYLVAELRDGRKLEFAKELNTKPIEDSPIHRLADRLNRRAVEHRSGGSAGQG
jgi:Bacterial PH domain